MTRNRHLTGVLAAALVLTVSACDDSASPTALISDVELTADIAAASGEAIANDLGDMLLNETFAGLPAPPSFSLFGSPPGVTVTRTRACYGGGVLQTQCDAITTDSIVFTMTKNGSFTRSHTGPRGSETFTAAVHEARSLTISGLAGTETSRTHNGTGTGNDTTEFEGVHSGVTLTRRVEEASNDSVQAIVFNLPHATNPWPASGRLVRNVSGEVEISATGGPNGDRSETRSYTRRIVVTFPADAQGNVVIEINNQTCNLNLVTRRITGCV